MTEAEIAASRLTPVSVELTVVVPVYGCAECLWTLHQRLSKSVSSITADYELLFVDDRSPDGAWAQLSELAASDERTRALRLSRNFGQHAAITAGLAASRGRWVVVIDCDLQDPPEEIPRLYSTASEGHDIVYTLRDRSGTPRLRRLAARAFFRLMNTFARTDFEGEVGSFTIISRPVVEQFLRFRDRDRHFLFILRWLGFDSATIEITQSGRHSGSSAYGLRSLLAHALDGLFFQTTVLLRWVIGLGFLLSTLGLGFAGWVVFSRITGNGLPGWASLAVFTLTIGGFIIISTGITGLYIGRIFEQVRERPLFVIDADTDDLERTAAPARPPDAGRETTRAAP
jgi:dolichol-phosphate mannosyltransferase